MHVRGTKSKAADRTLSLPAWLCERLADRADARGAEGYVFPSPRRSDPEAPWDQSNAASALREALDGAGLDWAVPHTLRRSAASRLHEADIPL